MNIDVGITIFGFKWNKKQRLAVILSRFPGNVEQLLAQNKRYNVIVLGVKNQNRDVNISNHIVRKKGDIAFSKRSSEEPKCIVVKSKAFLKLLSAHYHSNQGIFLQRKVKG